MGCNCYSPRKEEIYTDREDVDDDIKDINFNCKELDHYNNNNERFSMRAKKIKNVNHQGDKFIKEIVNEINKYRSRHGSDDLIIDENINEISQSYSEKLARESIIECSGNLYKGQELGEILFSCNENISPKELIYNCYIENSENYDYSQEPSEANNFTQLVWKNTEYIGVGYSLTKENTIYVVLNFYPPGNIKGEYLENVLPPDALTETSTISIMGNLYEEMLSEHNNLRFKHRVPSLNLNANLSTLAQKYANYIYDLYKKGKKTRWDVGDAFYEGEKCGINIFIGKTMEGKEIMNLWYKQKEKYDFRNHKHFNQQDTKNFTQLVWKNTRDLGFGCVSYNNNENMIFVVLYFPCGNIEGEYKYNVFDED